jgi:peroxiredoxin Q/BCP
MAGLPAILNALDGRRGVAGKRAPWAAPPSCSWPPAPSHGPIRGSSYLLWFFPKAMTPGCTAEGRQLRDRFAAFRARGVEVLGVSFDPPAANAELVRAEGFPFRLLSDEQRRLAVAVGAARSAEQPHAARISYLVGPDGRVRRAYADVAPARHAAEVLGDLDAGAAP